jgi:hypothetical protein
MIATSLRQRTPAALGVLLAALLILLTAPVASAAGGSGGETIDVAIPPTGTVACHTKAGASLRQHSALHPGDGVTCVVAKLAAREQVGVTLGPGGHGLGTAKTDAKGGLTFRFAAPSQLGAHTVTFTGRTSKATAVFAFTVVRNGHPGGGGPGRGGGGPGGGGRGPGGLVFTGVAVLGPVLAAAVLIGGGVALTATNRRRRRRLG